MELTIVAGGVEVVMVTMLPVGLFDELETDEVETVCTGIGPVTIVKVTIWTPGIVVAEFGRVVTAVEGEGEALGVMVITMTLLLGGGELAGKVTRVVWPAGIVTTLEPGSVVVAPGGPPVRVTTEFDGAVLCGIITTLVPPAGTVKTLDPGSIVVRPDGPPLTVTTDGGRELLGGNVSTVLPLERRVRTLVPPGKIVVKPDRPPESVVRTPLAVGDELSPSIMVATLPFGRVVTTPVPQIGLGCAELFDVVVFCGEIVWGNTLWVVVMICGVAG